MGELRWYFSALIAWKTGKGETSLLHNFKPLFKFPLLQETNKEKP